MADIAQRNFAAGEVSPQLYFRADQTKYLTGCRKVVNFYVRKSGGLSNRPGLRFIAECNTYASAGSITNRRLVKFIFNDAQTYVLEFTASFVDGWMRIIKQGALITILPDVWSSLTSYIAGHAITYLGVNYIAIRDNLNKIPSTNPLDWTSLGTSTVFRIPSPYTAVNFGFRYQQSGDTIICVEGQTFIQEINRVQETRWRIRRFTTDPSIAAPAGLNVASGGAGSNSYTYTVTSVRKDSFEESLPATPFTINSAAVPTAAAPHTVTWTADANAVEYNVYKTLNGKMGFIGSSGTTSFEDVNINPDTTLPPPRDQNVFEVDGLLSFFNFPNVPTVVGFVQQRLCFGASVTEPEAVWMSRIGLYRNFTNSLPIQDDDSIKFALAGKKISQIRAILEVGAPLLFTANGEFVIAGDDAGSIIPTAINPQQKAFNGCSSYVDPIVVDDTVLYVQGRGSVVRDLKYKLEDTGYDGRDLTVYASHLFENRRVVAWDYAQNPDSLVWVILDDGSLLCLSYLREHQIWGWTRQQTQGKFKDVVVVPEGDRDAPYFIVERDINGIPRYYIERMERRVDTDPRDAFFVDSGLSYDGTNTTATTMTLTSAAGGTVNDVLNLTASSSYFSSADVGNAIILQKKVNGVIELELTCKILAYLSPTYVEVSINRDVVGTKAQANGYTYFAGVPLTTWAKAVDEFSGLDHIANQSVAIVADGDVISNGYDEPLYPVSLGGMVTLPRPAYRVHIGLPYRADMESLDLEARDGSTVRQRTKTITHCGVLVTSTSSIKAGTSFDDGKMNEYKIRDFEPMGMPTQLKTGFFDAVVQSGYDEEIRVCIRQDNPLPATISGLIPRVLMGA